MSEGKRTAYASLPLHGEKAPAWVFSRMVLPAREIRRYRWLSGHVDSRYLSKILLKTYERAPQNFGALLGIEGVGPQALLALAAFQHV